MSEGTQSQKGRFEKLIEEMLQGKIQKSEWDSMTNDIERYNKMIELVINAYTAVIEICPPQVKVLIEAKVKQFKTFDFVCEFEEFEAFLGLAKITSTSLQGALDDKKVADYAAPHQIITQLDSLCRINDENEYSEDNVAAMGAAMAMKLMMLKTRLETIDWKKGWKD